MKLKLGLSILLSLFLLTTSGSKEVSAGDEACTDPSYPTCWPRRVINEYGCFKGEYVYSKCVSGGETGVLCGLGYDPCPENWVCTEFWAYGLTIETFPEKCEDTGSVQIYCNTSNGNCGKTVDPYKGCTYQSSSGTCTEVTTKFFSCCGGDTAPTPPPGGGGGGCTDPNDKEIPPADCTKSGFYGVYTASRGSYAYAYSCDPIAQSPVNVECKYYTSAWNGYWNVAEDQGGDYEFHVVFNPALKLKFDIDGNAVFNDSCPSVPSWSADPFLGDKYFFIATGCTACKQASYRPNWLNSWADSPLTYLDTGAAACNDVPVANRDGKGIHLQTVDENTYDGETYRCNQGPIPLVSSKVGLGECPISALNSDANKVVSDTEEDWYAEGYGHSYFTRTLSPGSHRINLAYIAFYGDQKNNQVLDISYRKVGDASWIHLNKQSELPGGKCPVSPCKTTPTDTPTPPQDPPWWQAIDSDLVTNGNIKSIVPSGEALSLDGPGGYPGIALFGGALTYTPGALTEVGSTAWNANTNYSSLKFYDYAYFEKQVPQETLDGIAASGTISETPIDGGAGRSLSSGGYRDSRGYYWYKYTGTSNLIIDQELRLGSRKVILLVPGKSVTIQKSINLLDGSGFFAVFAGRDAGGLRGNIVISDTVGDGADPDLEGIYFADGTFSTGTGGTSSDKSLHIRGAVASLGLLRMQRRMEDNTLPAEVWEFGPDQVISFLKTPFGTRKMSWKEVAP